MKQLSQTEIDEALMGSEYEGASEGTWQNNFRPTDEDQNTIHIGIPDYDNGAEWGSWEPIAEVDGFDLEDAKGRPEEPNLKILTDSKLNAARAILLERLCGELVGALNELREGIVIKNLQSGIFASSLNPLIFNADAVIAKAKSMGVGNE